MLGICGSLRAGSYNAAALRVAQKMAPQGVSVDIAEIGDLPHYDDDLRVAGWPAPVARLRAQVAAADAILFSSPEYNYSVPGVLKNAIDWVSRPPDQPFAGKPAAILGASPGMLGTVRMQYHLRQIMVFLDMKTINKPEVMIGHCAERFDANGELTHAPTRELIVKLLESLRDWTRRLQRGAA